MKKNIRRIGTAVVVVVWFALTMFAWFGPEQEYSLWERRPLDKMPAITTNDLLNGSFMVKFEDYTLDQFPLRDNCQSPSE